MAALRSLGRLARGRAAGRGQAGRGFAQAAAGAEVALAEDTPFLRFATPVAQKTSLQQYLGQLPPTEVPPPLHPGSPSHPALACMPLVSIPSLSVPWKDRTGLRWWSLAYWLCDGVVGPLAA